MRGSLLKLLLIGCCLSGCQLRANESSRSEQGNIEVLQLKFEQEMKTQLAQKNIDDYSFDEISDIALNASQKVYGAHPQQMKQKVLFDLQQLPELDAQTLSKYQTKESLDFNEIFQTMSGFPKSQTKDSDDHFLPLFYGRKPEFIAHTVKNALLARYLGAKQFGQRTMISQFLPDKTYRRLTNTQSQLVVKTFEDDLFLISVRVTESGLLKPLQVDWMQLKVPQSNLHKH